MRLHRRRGDPQLLGDLSVRQAAGNEPENPEKVALPVGEFGEHLRRLTGWWQRDIALDQPAGHRWREQGLTNGRGPDGRDQVARGHIFEQIARRAGLQRRVHVAVHIKGRQDRRGAAAVGDLLGHHGRRYAGDPTR